MCLHCSLLNEDMVAGASVMMTDVRKIAVNHTNIRAFIAIIKVIDSQACVHYILYTMVSTNNVLNEIPITCI